MHICMSAVVLGLRCSFLPHFLESVLLRLEVSPVLVGGLGHVGQQVAKLHELPPGLLVVLASGVGQLRRLDPKVDNVRILDAARARALLLPVQLVHPQCAGLLAGERDQHALHLVRDGLPLGLGHLGHGHQIHLLDKRRVGIEHVGDHLVHGENLLAVL